MKPSILITGAAGRIGSLLRAGLADDPALLQHFGGPYGLKATDIVDPRPGACQGEVHVGDLADAGFVDRLFEDGSVQAVIHLAGYPREADWDVLLDANIRSTINLWEAARKNSVERVLYASSNHAIGFYPRSQRIDATVPPRPDTRYGLTKAFGEQTGFLYAYKFGVRFFGMRIGMFLPEPTTYRGLSTWLSHRDMLQLAKVGLTSDYTCEIVYGVSENSRSFWDNSAAYRLGYAPQDSADAYSERFPHPDEPPDDPAGHFQGGPYITNGLTSTAAQRAELDRR